MAKINHEEYKILKGLDNQWKWIARDEDLSVYDDKPVKVHSIIPCWDISTAKNEWQRINRSLFQFIQWSDSEPYNITELIGEYEGEETEVKKDIEWLKRKVLGLQSNGNDETDQTEAEKEIGRLQKWAWNNCVHRVFDLIIQLDEPEVLSQEWIDSSSVYIRSDGVTEEYVHVDDLKNLLVPKQELPVIPKFVAEYLDFAKSDVPLMRVMELANTRNEWPKWEKEYDWISANDELFVRAWLDGFTIANEEEEQKFYVILEENSYGAMGLGIDREGRLTFTATYDGRSLPKLTEQEIKDYDERYIPFMVPVEEVEENDED